MRRRLLLLLPLLALASTALALAGSVQPASAARPAGADAAAARHAARPLLVFAAASLTDALRAIGPVYTRQTGESVTFSYAASSTLARQIEAGAQADVFFSADVDWMDFLQSRHLIEADTRRDIVGNRLALIAPADSRVALTIDRGFDLAGALGRSGRLAIAEPDSVPAGRYAQEALHSLGVWRSVAGRLVPAENVRAALEYVARGEAPLGIVYATDALIEPRVRVVALFPPGSHPPIEYPAAAVIGSPATAAGFVRFLASGRAQAIFHKYGFEAP
jgi:molybdate transport system substrate-binding protein